MQSIERALGQLEAYQKGMAKDISEIKESLEALKAWRWRLLGATSLISACLSLAVTILIELMRR